MPEAKTNFDMIEVRPLKPFVGSYPCELKDADMIDDVLVEKPGGLVVKEKMPRKRFIGLVSVQRTARPDELERIARKEALPENIEISEDVRTEAEKRAANKGQAANVFVIEHPKQRTVTLPPDVASNLIERGLAERVQTKGRRS